MEKSSRQDVYGIVMIFLLIAAAVICRHLSIRTEGRLSFMLSLVRNAIYIGIAIFWAVSIRHRILQSSVRRYLLAIAILIMFWLVERTCKYLFLEGFDTATRYFWYGYYIPMILIPLMGLLAVDCMGKPESYTPSKRKRLLYIPAFLLIALVFTNDLHQKVFVFDGGVLTHGGGGSYTYGPLYFVAAAWILLTIGAFLILLWRRSRIPGIRKRILVPFIPILFAVLYGTVYATAIALNGTFSSDMTAVFCLVALTTFEMCIRVGLIQSNTHYTELFRLSSIAAQITDSNHNVLLTSDPRMSLSPDIMCKSEESPVLLPDSTRISGAAISCGYVFWREDVSKLTRTLTELEYANEYLLGKNMTLAESCKTGLRRRHLAEQNRLYNKMQAQTAAKLTELSELTDLLESAEAPMEERRLLMRLCVLGAYIKRRNNLIFLAEESSVLPFSELQNCVRESFQNLELFGIQCDYRFDRPSETLPFSSLMYLYDMLEDIIEQTLWELTGVYLAACCENGLPVMAVRLTGAEAPPMLAGAGIKTEKEDEREWRLTLCVPGEVRVNESEA